jgi:polyribonucleotide nucleotidyltransferase
MSRGPNRNWTAVHRAEIPLPTGVSPGAIIGGKGSIIKQLSEQSGARVWICNATGKVQISGSATAVAKALQLVSEAITAAQAIGKSYGCCLLF